MIEGFSLSCGVRREDPAPPPIAAFEGSARVVDVRGDLLLELALPLSSRHVVRGYRVRAFRAPLPTPRRRRRPDVRSWSIGRFASPARTLGLAAAIAVFPAQAWAGSLPEATAVADEDAPGPEVWDALVGRRVEITLTSGLTITGQVLSRTNSEVVFAQDPSGNVVNLSQAEVRSVRVTSSRSSSAKETDDGARHERSTGMKVTGIIFTSLGAATLTGVAVATAVSSSFLYYGWPAAVAGATMLGVGIPLWVVGAQSVSAGSGTLVVGPLHDGWQGRLTVQF